MTAPYYSDDQVTLYHADCLEIDAWQRLNQSALLFDKGGTPCP